MLVGTPAVVVGGELCLELCCCGRPSASPCCSEKWLQYRLAWAVEGVLLLGGRLKGQPAALDWMSCIGAETGSLAQAGWKQLCGMGSGAGVSASYPAAGRSTAQPAHGTAELLQASWLRSSLGFEGKDRVFCCFSRTWGSLAVGKVVGVILHCPRNAALRMGKLVRGRDGEKESQRKGSHALWPPWMCVFQEETSPGMFLLL